MVRPGERRYSVAAVTNVRQARLYVRAAATVAERAPVLKKLIENVSDDEITFRNRTALAAFPCTSRGVRGWPVSSLLFDEAAHMLDTEGNQAAEPLFRALVPAPAQFGNRARVIVSSTPYGQDGFFSEIYQRASSGELKDAQAQHATTAQVNPTITEEFLEQERERDPDGFQSEYQAQFLSGGLAFIERERLQEVVVDRRELAPADVKGAVLGFDPAFSRDPAAVAVVGRDPEDRSRLVLAHVQRWVPGRKRYWKTPDRAGGPAEASPRCGRA